MLIKNMKLGRAGWYLEVFPFSLDLEVVIRETTDEVWT